MRRCPALAKAEPHQRGEHARAEGAGHAAQDLQLLPPGPPPGGRGGGRAARRVARVVRVGQQVHLHALPGFQNLEPTPRIGGRAGRAIHRKTRATKKEGRESERARALGSSTV